MKEDDAVTWYEGVGRLTLDMTWGQALSVAGAGDHYEDAKALVRALRPQLDPDCIREALAEVGAWDEDELADDEENLCRLAGCDIVKDPSYVDG